MTLFLYYETVDLVASRNAKYLEEGGRTWELDRRWSVRLDPSHQPGMNSHVHVMLRGNDVCILNRDGSPSHRTNPNDAPNWVLDRIRKLGLIEQSMLNERTYRDFSIPANLIRQAVLTGILEKRRIRRFREFLRGWPFRE